MLRALLVAWVLLLVGCGSGQLELSDPWVRPLPPGMSMTAAYASLHNATDQAIEFCAVHSTTFTDLELHRTQLRDGVSRMRRQNEFVLAAGERVSLEPGGLHLMLMGPTTEIVIGDVLEFELVACDGRSWTVSAPVREPGL